MTTAMLNRMREEHRHVGTITLGKAQHLAYPRDPPFQTSAEIPGQHGAAHESVRWHPHTLLLAQAFSLIPEPPYEWTGSHVLPQEHLSTLIPPIGRESQAVDKLLRDQGQGAIFLRASADPATLQRAGEAASYVLTAPPHEHDILSLTSSEGLSSGAALSIFMILQNSTRTGQGGPGPHLCPQSGGLYLSHTTPR